MCRAPPMFTAHQPPHQRAWYQGRKPRWDSGGPPPIFYGGGYSYLYPQQFLRSMGTLYNHGRLSQADSMRRSGMAQSIFLQLPPKTQFLGGEGRDKIFFRHFASILYPPTLTAVFRPFAVLFTRPSRKM